MWDSELISDLFNENDAMEILSIPISPHVCADRLIWHPSRNGNYSVRTAYKLACSNTIDNMHAVSGRWKALWKQKIPPRVKNFLWRVGRDCLPTKANLHKRVVPVNGECGICNQSYEDTWHSFVSCPFAEGCWKSSGLEATFLNIVDKCDSFQNVLFNIFDHIVDEERIAMLMLIWQIWRERNAAVWKNCHKGPDQTAALAVAHWREWSEVRNKGAEGQRGGNQTTCRGWHNLSPGWYRCGIDAAFFHNPKATGVGVILQDAFGGFVTARVLCIPGGLRVEEGEAMGLHEALSWIKELGFSRVIFETDSKLVVDALGTKAMDLSEFGTMIRGCRAILEERPSFRVAHIRRDANFMAHALARNSRDHYIPHVWDEPPDFVSGLPTFTCSCS